MSRTLLNAPGYFVGKFRITTTSRNGEYTTIEEGRGRCPDVKRDWKEGLLNATYHAVYRHVTKPSGKSDPSVTLISWKIFYRTRVTRSNVRVGSVRVRGKRQDVFRDTRGRFTKAPPGAEILTTKQVRKAF